MGKALNGDGSIKKRKTGKLAGKWRLQWSYQDPLSNEIAKVDKTFPTHGEAKKHLEDLKTQVRTGQLIQEANSKRSLTLAGWFDQLAGTEDNEYSGLWADEGLDAKTVGYRVGRFNKYVRADLGQMPLKHLTFDVARTFFKKIAPKGIGASTLQRLRADLVKVLNDAIDTYEKLPNMRNPFVKVKVSAPVLREAVVLPPWRVQSALAKQVTARDRAMLGLYLLGGLRLSEQMALEKEQIDFHRGLIVVDRAVRLDKNGRQTVGLPKGDKIRLVAMCPSLADLLKPLMANPGSYLFPGEMEDKPRMKKLVYETWKKIKKRGKLPPETVLRDCRLSHNNWIEKLMPIVSTSTRLEHMGHSTSRADGAHKGVTVNLRNYTRFMTASHQALADELERLLGLSDVIMAPMIDEAEDEQLDMAS